MKISKNKLKLSHKELIRWVRYDKHTGKMYRIRRIHPRTKKEYEIDKEVVSANNRGYRWLNILGEIYLVHRLVFLYMTGSHPKGEVDHINGDRQDNRWCNLRDSNSASNSRNQGVRKDSTSGIRGVTYSKLSGKWVARISNRGVRYSLGYFTDKKDACDARRKAEKEFGYHQNHGKRKSWSAQS